MLSSLSLIPNVCATGMEGNTFPLCRRRALRVNSLHSSEQWIMFNALNTPSTSLHATRVPYMVINSSRFFFGGNNTVIFTLLSTYFYCLILDASSSAFTFRSSKLRTRSFSLFCVSLWGHSEVTHTLEEWICKLFFVRFCFLCVFLFHHQIQIAFFWWLRHGQIYPMKHRSNGRGYIWIVNSPLLLSIHTTCHRRCQAKLAVTAVVWGFPPYHRNGKQHCHSLTIYPASKTYCTWFAHNVRHPLLFVTQFTPKVKMVGFLDQRRYRTPLWC